jgi:hypothetical protein
MGTNYDDTAKSFCVFTANGFSFCRGMLVITDRKLEMLLPLSDIIRRYVRNAKEQNTKNVTQNLSL